MIVQISQFPERTPAGAPVVKVRIHEGTKQILSINPQGPTQSGQGDRTLVQTGYMHASPKTNAEAWAKDNDAENRLVVMDGQDFYVFEVTK